jgi:anti-sigma regulatory factor (Ser/Thr protein kinase)
MLSRQEKLPPAASLILTVFLVIAWTFLLLGIQQGVSRIEGGGVTRPFSIGFVLVIGLATVIGGARCGALALLLSFLATVFVLPPHGFHDVVAHPRNQVETCFLVVVGALQVVGMVTLRQNRSLRADAAFRSRELFASQARLRESEQRRLTFTREVLMAATGGRLDLCDADELHSLVSGEPEISATLKRNEEVSVLRRRLTAAMAMKSFHGQRMDDLALCVTEAGMNAVKHGNGGTARVWIGDGEATVIVSDRGPGISSVNIARATLERGFSTQASLGMGFFMMMESADRLALHTSAEGTSILFRVGNKPRRSVEDSLLDSFGSL